eukprot:TRINITY_DN2740_c0_g2_i1.p1 TRINITY_DN2740_c0_g2~~TRINITY_DN2740_c0_g2_i1.p1  ORF type:complete len:135 (+),score=27.46 TRINITY_DN2740_c0_g2_i1:110-514(+)
MIRRPPRSTLSSSSAASDVYKRQYQRRVHGMQDQTHTIILLQFTEDPKTRSYMHYQNISEALDSIMSLYESTIKFQDQTLSQASYDISEIYEYIEKLNDLTILTYNIQIQGYVPRGKDWCKLKLFHYLNSKSKQ